MGQVLYSVSERIVVVVVAASILFLMVYASKARAADSRWYVGMNLPVMYIDDTDTTTQGENLVIPDPSMPAISYTQPYSAKARNKFDTGYKIEGVVGYELGSNFRIEIELYYAEADVDKLYYSGITTSVPVPGMPQLGLQPISIPGKTSIPVSGSAEQMGGMLNLWYDFHNDSKWIPYVGAGIGFIEVDFGDVRYDDNALAQHVANSLVAIETGGALTMAPPLPPGYVPKISRTDTVLAYQAAAGVSYKYSDNIQFRLGYRYQTSDDLEFDGKGDFGTVDTKTEFDVQFLEIGMRYHF